MKHLFSSVTKFPKIFLGVLFLVCFFGCQKDYLENRIALDPSSGSASATEAYAANGNFMVITKSEVLPSGFETKLSAYGEIVQSIPEIGVIVVKPTTQGFETKVAKLTQVKAVVPDLVSKWLEPMYFNPEASLLSIGSNEPFFGYQWGMRAIDAPGAWDAGYTGEGARVFILDAGIDADNPELSPNLNTELSTSFVPGEGYNVRPGLYFNHGTHVAGIVAAADNQWGVIGVAPGAELVAVKVLSEYNGSGAFSWINAGIVYAANNGADIINMSLGGRFYKNGFYTDANGVLQKVPAIYFQSYIIAQKRAVDYAFKKGAVIIASAGNTGNNADGNGAMFILPADLEKVIAVSATGPDCWMTTPNPDFDLPASYSDFGRSLVDIAAPGGDYDCNAGYPFDMILSTGTGDLANGYYFFFAAGTSMAAPHVTGVAALIVSKNGGEMSPVDLTTQLLKTSDNIDGEGTSLFYGKGRVNALRAVTE